MHALLRSLDPRRSLASAVGWLIFALSISLALAADYWVDGIVRGALLDLKVRQLDTSAARLATRLNLNLAARVQKVRVLSASLARDLAEQSPSEIRATLENVQQTSPEFDWIAVATPNGYGLAGTHGASEGTSVAARDWFEAGLRAAPSGQVQLAAVRGSGAAGTATTTRALSLTAAVLAPGGQPVGVIGAQLGNAWRLDLAHGLRQEMIDTEGEDLLLVDTDGTILIGPPGLEGRVWVQTPAQGAGAGEAAGAGPDAGGTPGGSGAHRQAWLAHLAQGPDGSRWLVTEARADDSQGYRVLGWRVLVLQSLDDASRSLVQLQRQIAAILVGLGMLAAVVGIVMARRMTRKLEAIAQSADAIRQGATQAIAVPAGDNEPARLGRALAALLASLGRERQALQSLNVELDQRVAARTRDVERMAEQARYDALARERLRLARDLHDTLAHSMMVMLSEVRLLRRLWSANPAALGEELERAEQAAQQGLEEARAAIAQIRFNPVRDGGLVRAVQELARGFVERTGIPVQVDHHPAAPVPTDERAETLFRIIEEALRNVERHAGARSVVVTLAPSGMGGGLSVTVYDDGVGFDAAAQYPGHYGLAGLREQAQLIGARLLIDSRAGQGTTIRLTLEEAPATLPQ